MGFPVGYSELLIPKLLLRLLLVLSLLRRSILWLLRSLGLGDLLIDCDDPVVAPSDPPSSTQALLLARRPAFHPLAAVSVDAALPVVRFGDLGSDATPLGGADCAVCLCDITGGDEVRRLPNCRHVFHRCCLDRWMAHDWRTCPLCRAPLLSGEDAVVGTLEVDDAIDELSFLDVVPSPMSLPSPTMPRPHELLASLSFD